MNRSSAVLESLGNLDRALLDVLESYLELRSQGPVDRASFLSQHESLAEELEPLLASMDALEALGPHRSSGERETRDDSIQIGWEDLTCQTIGDYQIAREVGRGGMGVVYEARQISLDRVVALKVLPLSIVLDETRIARFLVEAQAAAQLQHPNIVPIYSIGCEDGLHCYSMLFIDGVSLDRYRETFGELDQRQCVEWMIQAARGLDHAHQRGVIHRDVKPSNMMIDEEGKIWVTDFGLARCRNDSSLTKSGAIVGTLRYMSPEQASGRPHLVDHRSDIYSLGLTLYELVTGKAAFPDDPGHAPPRYGLTEPIAPRRVNAAVPIDLETILLKSIATESSQRYDTAAAFAEDLARFLAGKPIMAARPSALDRLSKWTSRHRRSVAAGLGILLIAFIASLATTALFIHKQGELRAAIASKNAQEAIAQENFRRTREVLDHFGLLVAEKLADVPGAAPIRKQMVRDLLEYYEQFVVSANDAPGLREELAQTHFRAGRIVETLGGTEQALKAYHRAQSLYQQLASDPSTANDEIDLRLALCHNNIGMLDAEAGRAEAAEHEYRTAIRLLAAIDQPASQVRRELAGVYGNLGLLFSAKDEISPAARALETSLDLLIDGTPSQHNTHWRLEAAMTLNNLGYLYQDSDVDRALGCNDRAIETLRQLVRESETETVLHPLATSLNNRASLLAKQDRMQESLNAYREALELYQGMVEESPYMWRFLEELAITYNNLGRLLTRMHHLRDATDAFDRSEKLLTELCRSAPQRPRYFASLGGVLNNQARVSMQGGRIELAIAQYQDSLARQQELQEMTSDTESYEAMLITTYENYESALRQSGRKAEAERIRSIRHKQQAQ